VNQLESLNPRGLVVLFAVITAISLGYCSKANASDRDRGTVVGGRPAACHITIRGRLIPFCACALSVRIFGRVINSPNLKLASTWPQVFPRTTAAPGMVAARSGHAFQLVSHVQGNVWTVWDANSGRGQIRIHQRSISGFVIVNPLASRMASR
jgi:hypothetical protein